MSINYRMIGQRIQNERKRQNMTQERMAEALSVTVGYISQIERGVTKINLETLKKISDFLSCDISDFLIDITSGQNSYYNELEQKFNKMTQEQKRIFLGIADVLVKDN